MGNKNCLDCLYCKVSAKSIGNSRYCYCSIIRSKGLHIELFWNREEPCEYFKNMAGEEEKPDNKNINTTYKEEIDKNINTTHKKINNNEKNRNILVRPYTFGPNAARPKPWRYKKYKHKYEPLKEYLESSKKKVEILSFQQIEAIIENKLPPSAYNHHANMWWANGSFSQQLAWKEAEYKATLDLINKKVIFYKIHQLPGFHKSKYELLRRYLLKSKDKKVTMNFEEIETIIGHSLPSSAYNDWWWANGPQQLAWTNARYNVDIVDLINEKVTFHKMKDFYEDERVALDYFIKQNWEM